MKTSHRFSFIYFHLYPAGNPTKYFRCISSETDRKARYVYPYLKWLKTRTATDGTSVVSHERCLNSHSTYLDLKTWFVTAPVNTITTCRSQKLRSVKDILYIQTLWDLRAKINNPVIFILTRVLHVNFRQLKITIE